MSRDDDFQLRIGRIRDRGVRRHPKPFISRVLASAEKADGLSTRRRRNARSTFGRGRTAAFLASRSLTDRLRRVDVKARVVRQKIGATAPLSAHLSYLRRDGVSREGDRRACSAAMGRTVMLDSSPSDAGATDIIPLHVSPDDAFEMTDLRAFTCDLMTEVERDLGTKLDSIAVDHGKPSIRASTSSCVARPMIAVTW